MILISILLFSLNNILWKKNLAQYPMFFLMSSRAFFTSLIALSGYFMFQAQMPVTPEMIFRISLGGSMGVIGLFCMLSIIQVKSLQWVAIYNILGIFGTTVYLWFFEETKQESGWSGIALIITGYLLFIYFNAENTHFRLSFKNHLLLLIMTICFSSMGIVQWKNVTNDTPSLIILATQELMVFFAALFAFFFLNKERMPWGNVQLILPKAFIMSIMILLALYFSLIGSKVTNPVICSLLFLANPITTILFSALYFKEKMNPRNIVALAILCTGAFLLHLSQN